MRIAVAGSRVVRPGWVWIAVALQIFVGVMAVPVGLLMIADPTGDPVGIPNEWIANTPFGSFLIPGLFLLFVNGIGQLAAATLAVMRHWFAPWLMGGLGLGLVVWIAVQVLIIPLSFLQPTILVIGVAQCFVALFWLRSPRPEPSSRTP
jgi:hypothetical protein